MAHHVHIHLGAPPRRRTRDAVRHDPHSGKFTSAGQHKEAAEYHGEMSEMHRAERKRFDHLAAQSHQTAARLHGNVAKVFGSSGYPRHAESAHTASAVAEHYSRRADVMRGDSVNDAATLTKAETDYGPGYGSERCGLCTHFQRPNGCELVMGTIRDEDWCNRFDRTTRDAYAPGKNPASHQRSGGGQPQQPRYNRGAVEEGIKVAERRGQKIGHKERRLIHALLKGHQRGDE